MIVFRHRGNFNHTEAFLTRAAKKNYRLILEKYAKDGVAALSAATPKETGKTAASWSYEITIRDGNYRINWTNSNVVDGVPIAIIIQYGHGTRNGGYVEGLDYINPALKPILEKLADEVWREVTEI